MRKGEREREKGRRERESCRLTCGRDNKVHTDPIHDSIIKMPQMGLKPTIL